jgi:hypothetical protein
MGESREGRFYSWQNCLGYKAEPGLPAFLHSPGFAQLLSFTTVLLSVVLVT